MYDFSLFWPSRDMTCVLAIKEREIQRLRLMLAQLTAPTAGGVSLDAASAAMAEFGPPSSSAATSNNSATEKLQAELGEMRRALASERAMRENLEAQLHHQREAGGANGSGAGFGGGERGRFDYLQVDAPSPGGTWGEGGSSGDLSAANSPSKRIVNAWGPQSGSSSPMRHPAHRGSGGAGRAGMGGNNRRSVSSATRPVRSSAAPLQAMRSSGNNLDEAIRAIRLRIQQLSMPGARPAASAGAQRQLQSGGRASSALVAHMSSPYGQPKINAGTRRAIGAAVEDITRQAYASAASSSSQTFPSSPGASGGWGRTAMLSKFADSPAPPQLPGGGRHFDQRPAPPPPQLQQPRQQQQQLPSSHSPSPSGWGRTSLQSGGSGAAPANAGSGGWGRGSVQVSAPSVEQLISDMFSQPVTVRGSVPLAECCHTPDSLPQGQPQGQQRFGRSTVTPPPPPTAGQQQRRSTSATRNSSSSSSRGRTDRAPAWGISTGAA